MTSTVLDVGVFLLLASASVLALVAVDEPVASPSGGTDVLATTATVTVDPGPPDVDAGTSPEPGHADRRVHGSLRELIARAAVANAGVDDATVDPDGVAFRRAVERAVASRLGPHTRIHASWQPVAGSRFGGEVAVGPSPPSDRPVRAAVVAVPAPFPPADASDAPSVRSFASAFVDARFPPNELRATLRGNDAAAAHAAVRYRHAGEVVLGNESAIVHATPREANAAIARGLAETLSDESGGPATPSATGEADAEPPRPSEPRQVTVVRIVVRWW